MPQPCGTASEIGLSEQILLQQLPWSSTASSPAAALQPQPCASPTVGALSSVSFVAAALEQRCKQPCSSSPAAALQPQPCGSPAVGALSSVAFAAAALEQHWKQPCSPSPAAALQPQPCGSSAVGALSSVSFAAAALEQHCKQPCSRRAGLRHKLRRPGRAAPPGNASYGIHYGGPGAWRLQAMRVTA